MHPMEHLSRLPHHDTLERRQKVNKQPKYVQGRHLGANDAYNASRSALLSPVYAQTDEPSGKEPAHENAPDWQPYWLRKPILVAFCCWFLFCMASLLVLLILSKRDRGIGLGSQNLSYLYRFSPTAILTITVIFLSRVELQALRYFPWAAVQNSNRPSPEVYYLDYASMILPLVLFRSVQRKHFLVTLASMLPLLLRTQIVLSPALFQIRSVESWSSAKVRVLDSFITSKDPTMNMSSSPLMYRTAMRDYGLDYPFGVLEQGAYQTFESATQDTRAQGLRGSPLRVTVDGFFVDVKCRHLQNFTTVAGPIGIGKKTYDNVTVDMHFESCDLPYSRNFDVHLNTYGNDSFVGGIYLLKTWSCSSLSQQRQQYFYYGCFFEANNNTLSPPPAECGAVVCSPEAWVSQVEVLHNGLSPKLIRQSNETRTPIQSDIWSIIYQSTNFPSGSPSYVTSSSSYNWGPLETYFTLRGKSQQGEDKSACQTEALAQAFHDSVQQLGPLAAHNFLRKADQSEVEGSYAMDEYTLRVNERICQSMMILLGISALITAYIALRSITIKTKWHRDPATVLGSLTFFQARKGHHTELVNNGPRCEEEKLKWSDSESSLLILTSKFRVAFTLYSLALIGGLAVTLRLSQTAEGLATIGAATNISLWWRVIPALAMFMVTVYINAVDYTIRDLATFFLLSVQKCNLNELDDSLLDMLGFRALLCSLQRKFYAISFSQVQVTICAFLVTLSSLLFTTEIKPGYTDTEFQLSSWFANRSVSLTQSITFSNSIWSLVYQENASNFSYPKNTYADLLFPAIDIDSKLQILDSSKSIVIETPAAKLVPNCSQVPEHQYNISISDGGVNSNVQPHFSVIVSQDFSCPHSPGDGSPAGVWGQDQFQLPTGQKSVYVGRLIQTPENLDSVLCGTTVGPNWSLRTYLWGEFSREKGAFDYVTVWKCNYTWAEVKSTVEMVYSNGNFVIDHSRPPTKDQNEMRLWNPPFPVPPVGLIAEFGQTDIAFPTLQNSWNTTGNFLSGQFQGILEPYGSITREDLGKPGREAQILDALNYRLGSVSVQLANKDFRLSLNETSGRSLSNYPPTLPPVYAKIKDNKRIRLLQDSKVTIAIIAILAVVVFVNMWALISALLKRRFANGKRSGCLLNMEFKGLVPDGFGSISSVYHLLDGSNMLQQIPHEAHSMSQQQLVESTAGIWFRMGWFWNTEDQKIEYTIGALGDEEFQFLVDKTEVIS